MGIFASPIFASPIFGNGAVGGVTLTRSRIGSNSSTADATSYTFTGQGIGTAAADRFVVVAVMSEVNTAGMAASDVTVTRDGGAMTRAIDSKAGAGGSGQGGYAGLWIEKITSGTTADIVVDFGAFTQQHMVIEVYNINGNASLSTTPTDTLTTNSGTIDIPTGGVAIGVACGLAFNAIAWSAGLTLDHGSTPENASGESVASSNTAGAGQTVTATNTSVLAVAAWG